MRFKSNLTWSAGAAADAADLEVSSGGRPTQRARIDVAHPTRLRRRYCGADHLLSVGSAGFLLKAAKVEQSAATSTSR